VTTEGGHTHATSEVSVFELAGEEVNLHNAGREAIALAEVVEQVRVRYMQKAAARADEALRGGARLTDAAQRLHT
jgi:hypothetical protein